MILNVGSMNPAKIAAVESVALEYNFLIKSKIRGIEVPSEVPSQPRTLEETVRGAINRAKNAFLLCDYSLGIESGLMKVPYSNTGSLDFCCCAIYDGQRNHIGFSSAFEFPPVVTNLIEREGLEANEAFFRAGLTPDRKIGSSMGAVGLLTNGRVNRKEYSKQAIRMALVQIENPDLYLKA